MTIPSSTLLQVPAGSASLFFQDARTHRQALEHLSALYDRWAYLPVHTPLVDYSSPYHGMINESDQSRVYHLIGRDGAILMLRWDITMFLVKQVHSLIRSAPLPLRLSYADSVLRHQEADDISRNEYFQTGAELIGSPGPDGDLEIVLLLAETLEELGLAAVVHIGSRTLFEAAFPGANAQDTPLMLKALSLRDFEGLRTLAARSNPAGDLDASIRLFQYIGEHHNISQDLAGLKNRLAPGLVDELTRLADLVLRLHQLKPGLTVRFDPSEIGSQNYQSGLVFQAYLDGLDSAIASGGRYDRLLAIMGCPSPAVGFSLMLSKCLAQASLPKPDNDSIIAAQGADFAARYRHASDLRRQGKRVSL